MPPEAAHLEFTRHALDSMEERTIRMEWVERVVAEPMMRATDPNDSEVERFFRRIPEHGDRVLRVVVNMHVAPWRVISVFFDRGMRGKL